MVHVILIIIAFVFSSCGASTDVSLLGSLSENNGPSIATDDEDEPSDSELVANVTDETEPSSSISELIEIRDQHSEQTKKKIKSAE